MLRKGIFVLILLLTAIAVTFAFHLTQKDKINYYQGRRFFRRGLFAQAVPFYQKALFYNPSDISSGKELAICYLGTGEPEKALALLRPILARRPGDKDIRLLMGKGLYYSGDSAQAVKMLEGVIDEGH